MPLRNYWVGRKGFFLQSNQVIFVSETTVNETLRVAFPIIVLSSPWIEPLTNFDQNVNRKQQKRKLFKNASRAELPNSFVEFLAIRPLLSVETAVEWGWFEFVVNMAERSFNLTGIK